MEGTDRIAAVWLSICWLFVSGEYAQMTTRNGIAARLSRDLPPERDEAVSVFTINTCFGAGREPVPQAPNGGAGGENVEPCELSVRALNVLKLLAAEMTGKSPPKENWVPPTSFLQGVTFDCLAKARNCGPLTIAEIIRWAGSRGVSITPPLYAGKSLTETWRCLEARFAMGKLSKAELTEALEWSVRRRSVRIPLGIQRILMKLLNRSGDGPRQT